MVMQLLGPSLSDLMARFKRLSVCTVLKLGVQMVRTFHMLQFLSHMANDTIFNDLSRYGPHVLTVPFPDNSARARSRLRLPASRYQARKFSGWSPRRLEQITFN
jgi:hypothetical protein